MGAADSIRALRLRVFAAAPLDDLGSPIHDLLGELSHIEGEIGGIDYSIAAAEEAASDARRERRDLEHSLDRAHRALEIAREFIDSLPSKDDARIGQTLAAIRQGLR